MLSGVMAVFAVVNVFPVSAQRNEKLGMINEYNMSESRWRKTGDCDWLEFMRSDAERILDKGDSSYAAKFNAVNTGAGRRCGVPSLLYEGASVAGTKGTPMPSKDCISHADVLEFARTRVLHRICK